MNTILNKIVNTTSKKELSRLERSIQISEISVTQKEFLLSAITEKMKPRISITTLVITAEFD